MNIHLPAILMFTRGTRFWHTASWTLGTWLGQVDRWLPEEVENAGPGWTMLDCLVTFLWELSQFFCWITSWQVYCSLRTKEAAQRVRSPSYFGLWFRHDLWLQILSRLLSLPFFLGISVISLSHNKILCELMCVLLVWGSLVMSFLVQTSLASPRVSEHRAAAAKKMLHTYPWTDFWGGCSCTKVLLACFVWGALPWHRMPRSYCKLWSNMQLKFEAIDRSDQSSESTIYSCQI